MSKVVVVRREGGDEDWGDEIESLLNTVKGVMDDLFHKSACKDVYVEYSERGPMLVLEKNINKAEHYTILLSARGFFWYKFIYQFAHEYCHILIGTEKTYFLCAEGKYHFMWLEEALCQLASLDVLRHVIETKATELFGDNYKKEMNDWLNGEVDGLQRATDFKKWFTDNYEILSTDYKSEYKTATKVNDDDPVRERGEVVLAALLPHTQDPKFWVLIGKLEELQPFLESGKVCSLLQALYAVVREDVALVRCLKNIQNTLSTTWLPR